MLVSKIKPCMCKYKLVSNSETANGSLNQLWSLRSFLHWIPVVILELIHALKLRSLGRRALLLDQDQCVGFVLTDLWWLWITLGWSHGLRSGDVSFECLPYQMSKGRAMPPLFVTGNGESGFDSGEGAWETATTSKEGSRRANYPLLARGGSDEK